MTTAYDIALKAMRQVTDTMPGVATGGAATYLTDSVNLIQNDQYWDKGTVFIQSGTHAGKAMKISSHVNGQVKFAALGSAIAAGVRYTLVKGTYPWEQILSAMMSALDDTYVETDDDSLTGDGETLRFTLPAGVADIKTVEYERSGYYDRIKSTHWKERDGMIIFDYGHAPYDGDIIHLIYRTPHPEIDAYNTVIDDEINPTWLIWATARELLYWGAAIYQKDSTFMIEERLNKVLNTMKGMHPRREGVDVLVRTAGG